MTLRTQEASREVDSLVIRRSRCNVAPLIVLLVCVGAWSVAGAGTPVVEFVMLEQGADAWTAHTTVRHADRGWEHYADAWRIRDPQGNVLGTRTLYHPHDAEQPFTRSLSGLAIAPGLPWIEVQAHDKVHGWGAGLRIDLDRAEGRNYRIQRRH